MQELINEPLNRVLLLDKNSPLADSKSNNFKHWMEMNLVLFLDYENNTFYIFKNRWGQQDCSLPIELLGFFLCHPELTSEYNLKIEQKEFLRQNNHELSVYPSSI